MVTEWLEGTDEYVIYCGQVVAVGAYAAISYLTGKKPFCFAVGTLNGNPKEIDGIPVRLLNTVPGDSHIIVCATELLHREILSYLTSQGYGNIFVLTGHEEHLLMSEYFRRINKFPPAR